MKQLTGKANNIDSPIIGKITTENNHFRNKKDLIYVTSNEIIPSGYLAVITSQSNISTEKKNIVGDVRNITELQENDIVTIDKKGIISVVYDINSNHNVIFITERCNSNCIMCPQPPINNMDDYFDENIKLISLIDKNEKYIGITGGEPTLIGEKLFDILSAIHKRIPNASINILSNGIKFENYEYTKQFAQSIKQDLVIDIPLYSDIDSIHNSIVRTNSFYKTIKGIYNLAKFNIKIGLRIVIHKMNYERLPELAQFIYSNFPFVYHIAFMQMEPIGNAKDNLDYLWIDPIDYNKELEEAINILNNRDLHVSIYNAQLCILPEKLRKFAVQSISDWKNIYIEECNQCLQKEKCPGFFASSKEIHSRGIKPFKKKEIRLKLKAEITENNYLLNTSKKLLEFLHYFKDVKQYNIVDAPCGYGRNMYLLAKENYKLIGIDTDEKAISYIETMRIKHIYNRDNIEVIKSDLLNEWNFNDYSLGGVINIHFYRLELILKFKNSLIGGGYLYLETPQLHGDNYNELPKRNELRMNLEKEFDLLFYDEKPNDKNDRVSVILFARKKMNNNIKH